MKKILFLINNLNRGGAERTFVRQINELYKAGIPVSLGLVTNTSNESYREDLKIPSSHVFQFNQEASRLAQLRRIVREHDIDIVYSTLEMPNMLARMLKVFSWRTKVFIREGSARINKRGAVSSKPLKYRIFDVLMNWAPEKIIAVSDEIASVLKSYQPMYAKKIIVLENGVAIIDSKEVVEARVEVKAKRRELRILTVASMNYHERAFEFLIDALPLLPTELLKRTMLTFAGDGSLRPLYEAQVKKLNLGECIKFLGRVDTPTLMAEYREADVFVLCSTAEGSPNVILEAMSFGVPVVTTHVGSAVHFVKEGETGFFIPFKNSQAIADRLQWFIEHPRERKGMGVRSYDRIQALYSSETNMTALRNILGV